MNRRNDHCVGIKRLLEDNPGQSYNNIKNSNDNNSHTGSDFWSFYCFKALKALL